MKKLVIVVHPNIDNSLINKRWMTVLQQHPDKYVIHQLYKNYPDEKINVDFEQRLIEQYNKIVFQFPYYWFNSPPLFKKWLDEVLTYGWAYGSKSGYKVSGKKVALAISAGIDEDEYRKHARYKYTVEDLTRPFQLTFEYVKAEYQQPFVYYGIELNQSHEWIEKSVPPYLKFLESL